MPENKKEKPYANLLKAVPNEEAYNKLSPEDKKAFDRAMKNELMIHYDLLGVAT